LPDILKCISNKEMESAAVILEDNITSALVICTKGTIKKLYDRNTTISINSI
jgi:hypothetical protein